MEGRQAGGGISGGGGGASGGGGDVISSGGGGAAERVGPSVRVDSPAGTASRAQQRQQQQQQQQREASSPAALRRGAGAEQPTGGRVSPHPRAPANHDPALAAAGAVRPKVLFPPIGRPCNPNEPHTCGDGAAPGPLPLLGAPGSPTLTSPSPPRSPAVGPRTVAGGGAGGVAHCKSGKSVGTSVWAAPGSPIAPPDTREQFLIWLDSTFAAPDGAAGGLSGCAGFREEAQRRRQRKAAFEEQWGCGGGGGGGGGEGGACGGDARGLQRLLCRPLYHLWQDSPDAFDRQGADSV
jgi:hypothetical protein